MITRLSLGMAVSGTGLFCVHYLRVNTYSQKLAKATVYTSTAFMLCMVFAIMALAPAAVISLALVAMALALAITGFATGYLR